MNMDGTVMTEDSYSTIENKRNHPRHMPIKQSNGSCDELTCEEREQKSRSRREHRRRRSRNNAVFGVFFFSTASVSSVFPCQSLKQISFISVPVALLLDCGTPFFQPDRPFFPPTTPRQHTTYASASNTGLPFIHNPFPASFTAEFQGSKMQDPALPGSSSMDAQRAIVFQMPRIPGLLFPPPPPPILSYSSSYASPTSHHPSITSFPILVLTVLGILTTSVLLLAYYVFVIRCCLNWHDSNVASLIARRGHRHGGGGTATSSSTIPITGTPAEARGLQESTIQALPTFRYRKAIKSAAADLAPTNECAVCLSEFEEEERVRMLPSCLHAFHVDCIDTWLQGNANCPLCRAAITSHCIITLDQPQQPEEVVIQVAARTQVAEDTQAQQQQASLAAAESAGDTTTAQQVSRDKRNNAWRDVQIISKEDEWAAVKKDRDVLPWRRSSSMGSLGGEEVRLQIQNILQRNANLHRDDSGSASSSTV